MQLGVGVGDAFQVEGKPRFSDWYDWTHQVGKIKDYSNSDEGTRFLDKYEEDIQAAQNLGARYFKFSLSWERIEPNPGDFDFEALKLYSRIIECVHLHGMDCVIALHSIVLPRWVAKLGGTCSEEFPERFSVYCQKVIEKLGPHARESTLWLTFSRPLKWISKSYVTRRWPPGDRDFSKFLESASLLVQAHYAAVQKMRTASSYPMKISFLQGLWEIEAGNLWNPLDIIGAFYFRKNLNYRFFRSVFTGKNTWKLPGIKPFSRQVVQTRFAPELDFVALSFEGKLKVYSRPLPPFFTLSEKKSIKNSQVYDQVSSSLNKLLKPFLSRGLSIEFLEFSYEGEDEERIKFLDLFFKNISMHFLQRFNLKTLLYSRLVDAFEWENGYSSKRGLMSLQEPNFERVPKASYKSLKDIFKKYFPIKS